MSIASKFCSRCLPLVICLSIFQQTAVNGQEIEAQNVSWLAEIQQPPGDSADDAKSLSQILQLPEGAKVDSLEKWKTQRESIRKWWLAYLKPLDREGQELIVTVLKKEIIGDVERLLLSYESGEGWPTQAYLLKPAKIAKPVAGVVVMHSTVDHSIQQPAGVKGDPVKAFGLKLAQRGYVAICPRNFLWPTNDEIKAEQQAERFHRDNKSTGMAKMLFDAMTAVDVLTLLPYVDKTRLGAIGHSLGAKEALYLTAFDERIKVAVSSEGGIGSTFSNWDAPWYLGDEFQKLAEGHDHHELLALIAPRAFLLIGGNSADGDQSWPFIKAAMPVYELYNNNPSFGLFNHKQGHSVPREAVNRIYDWFETYLPPTP